MTLAFLCISSLAFAEVKEFGPDFFPVTFDVPDGWTSKTTDGGGQIVTPDNKSAIQFQIAKSNGKPAEEVANALAKEYKFDNIEKGSDSIYNIGGMLDGLPTAASVYVEDGIFMMIVMTGDLKTLSTVVETLKSKK